MVIAKSLENATRVKFAFAGAPRADGVPAQVWQLTAANRIERLADLPVTAGRARLTVPAQSVTLVVLPKAAGK